VLALDLDDAVGDRRQQLPAPSCDSPPAGDACASSIPVYREACETSSVRRSLMGDRPGLEAGGPQPCPKSEAIRPAGLSTTRAGVVCPVVGLEYEHLNSGLAGRARAAQKAANLAAGEPFDRGYELVLR
jgi:hypothetical protein